MKTKQKDTVNKKITKTYYINKRNDKEIPQMDGSTRKETKQFAVERRIIEWMKIDFIIF